MSAPSSGSPGDSPGAGYYADPSIPGYIRYWNGSAWVPGTSRPSPRPGEVLTPPPGAAAALAAPATVPPRTPAVDESGPMFLDEDPHAPVAQRATPPTVPASRTPALPAAAAAPEPGPAVARSAREPDPAPAPAPAVWAADASRQSGLSADAPEISWGRPAGPPAAETPPSTPLPPAQTTGSVTEGRGSMPQPSAGSAVPQSWAMPPGAQPAPSPTPAQAPPAGGWARQVQDLARHQEPGGTPAQQAGSSGEGSGSSGEGSGSVAPWRPVAADPFARFARSDSRPAGLGRRLLARAIDALLVTAVTATAAVPLGNAAYEHIQDKMDEARLTGETVTVWLIDGTTGTQLAIVLAVLLVTGLLYEVLPTVKWGRTLGKKLLGVRVLDIEAQLPPDFGPALRRWLTQTVLWLLGVGVVGIVWALFDRPWRQGWHDKVARTFVAGGG